jgi:hypothetical protein
MVKLPGFPENAPESLKKLFESDPEVVDYLNSIHAMENGKSKGREKAATEVEVQSESD